MAAKVWLSMRWGRDTALKTKGTGNFGMRKILYLDYDGDYIIDFFFKTRGIKSTLYFTKILTLMLVLKNISRQD